MAIASVTYVFILWITLSTEVQSAATTVELWVHRTALLLLMLSIVLCTFNYCDVQKLNPLCSHSNPAIRILGIALMDLLAAFTVMLLLAIIIS